MRRRLEPELLDSLPPTHPDALHSRADLIRLNQAMGNPSWFQQVVAGRCRPGDRVIELGGGDGTLSANLRRVAPRVGFHAIDRVPAPAGWPADARWHQADIRAFGGWRDYDVVIGNLILHHFDDDALRALGTAIRPHARLLVFNETCRRRRFQWLWAVAAPLKGANHVTRHDGRVSIAAGFRGDELARALGLEPDRWDWRVTETGLGAHRLVAERRP